MLMVALAVGLVLSTSAIFYNVLGDSDKSIVDTNLDVNEEDNSVRLLESGNADKIYIESPNGSTRTITEVGVSERIGFDGAGKYNIIAQYGDSKRIIETVKVQGSFDKSPVSIRSCDSTEPQFCVYNGLDESITFKRAELLSASGSQYDDYALNSGNPPGLSKSSEMYIEPENGDSGGLSNNKNNWFSFDQSYNFNDGQGSNAEPSLIGSETSADVYLRGFSKDEADTSGLTLYRTDKSSADITIKIIGESESGDEYAVNAYFEVGN